MELYDWQEADQERLRAAGYVGLLSVQPGGGKTVAAAWAIRDALRGEAESDRVVLIIAPQSTHYSAWGKTLRRLGESVRVIGRGSKAHKAALADFEWGVPGWYVCTPQFFTRAFSESWWPTAVIVDEAHMLCGPGTKAQKKLSGYTRRDQDTLATRAKYRLALSGTPARNKFERMWGVMRFLWPELSGRGQVAEMPFSAWKEHRMDFRFSPFAVSGKEFTHERYPGKLMGEAPCVVQHFRREGCCEFHPEGFMSLEKPLELVREYELTAGQLRAIRQVREQGLAWLSEYPLVAELPITQQLRVRQMVLGELTVADDRVEFSTGAASPAAGLIEEILESEGDEPVLVLTASKLFARFLTERLVAGGVSARELSGDTVKTRDEDVAGFGSEYRVAVAVIDAVGTGTDGLGASCAVEIWADRSLDRTNNTQAEARLDRMGQTRRVTRYLLRDSLGISEMQFTKQALASAKLSDSMKGKVYL